MAHRAMIVDEIPVSTRPAEQRPPIDVRHRSVQLWRTIKAIDQQIRHIRRHRPHLEVKRNGQRARLIDVHIVQIEQLRMRNGAERRDILSRHRRDDQGGIPRNDKLESMLGTRRRHADLLASLIENGQ